MDRKGKLSLRIGGIVFALIGVLTLTLFVCSELTFRRQMVGLVWASGMFVTGVVSCLLPGKGTLGQTE